MFTNWHQVIEAAKETEPSEHAFKKGLVIGLDPKEADGIGESEYFTYDDRVLLFVLEELNEERRANGQSIEGEDYLDLVDDYSALVYLRCKNGVLADFDQATKLCAKEFFFPPRYIRFNGEVKDDWLRADDECD